MTSGDEINANPVGEGSTAAVDCFRCVECHRVNAEDGRPAEEKLNHDDAEHHHHTTLPCLDGLKVGVHSQCLPRLFYSWDGQKGAARTVIGDYHLWWFARIRANNVFSFVYSTRKT